MFGDEILLKHDVSKSGSSFPFSVRPFPIAVGNIKHFTHQLSLINEARFFFFFFFFLSN